MSIHLEKHLRITCSTCGKTNTFSLFNPAPIAANDVVTCSHCRSLLGNWGDIAGARTVTTATSERPSNQKAVGTAARVPPSRSELH